MAGNQSTLRAGPRIYLLRNRSKKQLSKLGPTRRRARDRTAEYAKGDEWEARYCWMVPGEKLIEIESRVHLESASFRINGTEIFFVPVDDLQPLMDDLIRGICANCRGQEAESGMPEQSGGFVDTLRLHT